MPRRRKAALPPTRGVLVLDSGAVSKVAFADLLACSILEDLSRRGWTVCIPAVTLAEVIAGRARHDVPIERLVNRVANTAPCGEALAKAAGVLRTRTRRAKEDSPSGIDAIVAAVAAANRPSIVLTTDAGDFRSLVASTGLVSVIGV
jgi:predicted nucleic acid-binding protein